MAKKKRDDWYGKDMGFEPLEEFAASTRRCLTSNRKELRKAAKDNFHVCNEYLNYPKDLRSPERDRHARISRSIVHRIAGSLGLKL